METILKADIFFFITSIFVVITAIVFLVAGIYFIKILHNFYKISSILRKATESVDSGLKEMAEHVRNSPIFTFIFGKEKKTNEKNNYKRSV